MSISYEMTKYTELTGEDGTKVPISRLGGYLDGYEKGRVDMLEKCIEIVKYHENEYDGICWVIRELEELKMR